MPETRILRVREHHEDDDHTHDSDIGESDSPFDFWPHESMQPVQPAGHEGTNEVQPVDKPATERIFQVETSDPHQQETGNQDHQADPEQGITDIHRPSVLPIHRVSQMDQSEHDERENQNQTQHEMRQEHQLIEIVLISFSTRPFQKGDRGEVDGVRAEECGDREKNVQQNSELGADRAFCSRFFAPRGNNCCG